MTYLITDAYVGDFSSYQKVIVHISCLATLATNQKTT